MANAIEQTVIDAAVALCLAEKKLVAVGTNSMFRQQGMANAMGGDWIAQYEAQHATTDRAAMKAIVESEVVAAKVKLMRAVREFQDPMRGKV